MHVRRKQKMFKERVAVIKGFDHVGICVSNLEKSLEFYCGVLGFKQVSDISQPCEDSEESKAIGLPYVNAGRGVIIDTPNGEIELLDFRDKAEQSVTSMPVDSVGKLHLAFTVDDIEVEIKKLEANGIVFFGSPRSDNMGDDRVKWAYFKDPDGIMLEYVERIKK